jgi:hypothetical protein
MTAPAGGALKPESAIATQTLLTRLDRTMVFLLVRATRSNPIADAGLWHKTGVEAKAGWRQY